MPYLYAGECLYSIHGTIINSIIVPLVKEFILIIVPLVKEFITAMEVMIFELAFHKQ